MQTLVLSILQLSATLLLGAKHSTSISPALRERAIMTAHEGTAIAEYAMAQKFQPTNPRNLAPNIEKLRAAEYVKADGTWAHLSKTFQLDERYTSFGDIDHDNLDDAATILVESTPTQTTYSVVALANIAGPLVEVARLSLTGAPTIYDHHIIQQKLNLDMQAGNTARKIQKYTLDQNQLVAQ
jgi:hypothetical protein